MKSRKQGWSGKYFFLLVFRGNRMSSMSRPDGSVTCTGAFGACKVDTHYMLNVE